MQHNGLQPIIYLVTNMLYNGLGIVMFTPVHSLVSAKTEPVNRINERNPRLFISLFTEINNMKLRCSSSYCWLFKQQIHSVTSSLTQGTYSHTAVLWQQYLDSAQCSEKNGFVLATKAQHVLHCIYFTERFKFTSVKFELVVRNIKK